MTHFVKFADLQAAVLKARAYAAKTAREDSRAAGMPFTRSRGTWIATLDAKGQASPYPEAECCEWNGTKKEIDEAITLVLDQYPDVTEVYIAGGFDGAEKMTDFTAGEYEPWMSSWQVTVWTRGTVEIPEA